MSVCSVSSKDELEQILIEEPGRLGNGDGRCVSIERPLGEELVIPLLKKAASLKTAGERVLIVCADDSVVQRYHARLALFPVLASADIASMRSVCLRVLKDARVRGFASRGTRVLDENEQDVLVEDLKTSGVRPRRLREMLKFLYRGISEHEDERDGWLITAEERAVYDLLTRHLAIRDAALPCELPSLAYRCLESGEVPNEPLTVIVDDMGALSKASQRLLERLSRGCMVVAGNEAASPSGAEPYPYPEGFAAFRSAHADALRLVLDVARAPVRETCVAYGSPAAEIAGIASEVAEYCGVGGCGTGSCDAGDRGDESDAGGTGATGGADGCDAGASETLLPRDIMVAVPNESWGARVVAALASKGIPAVLDRGPFKVKGDPRRIDSCGELRLAAFLKLFLDPSDAVALRSWLGYGDWLLRSDAFLDVMEYVRERQPEDAAGWERPAGTANQQAEGASNRERQPGDAAGWERPADATSQRISMATAFDELRALLPEQRPATFAKLTAPLKELEELQKSCASISRADALALFARHGMELNEHRVGLLGTDPTHADITNLARRAFATDPFSESPSPKAAPAEVSDSQPDTAAVVVSPYHRCCGRRARVTLIAGLVNGFLPALDAVDDSYTIDHRRQALARQRSLFEAIRATASETLVYSFFKSDRLIDAETQKVQVTRVFLQKSERYAQVAPSVFIPSY